MKKSNKNYWLIILIAVCIIILLWMKPKEFSNQPEGEEIPSPVSSKMVTENPHLMEVPDNWHEEIDSYNSIDAMIDIPNIVKEEGFQKATAKLTSVKQDELLYFLEEFYHPQKEIEDEQVIQYVGKDNMYLYFFKEENAVSLVSSLRDYVSMAYREELTEDYNRDKYPINKEINGFSMNDCDEMIQKFCDSAGISGEINIVHRALDYKVMEAEAVELHKDGTRTKPDYEWGPNDNSYYCTISQVCNEIPIIPVYYLDLYADILNVGGHTCLLNKDRIISFYIENIYNVEYSQDYEKLLDFSEILDKYKKCLSISLQDYYTKVTDIIMRVIAVNQGDGSYKMTPVWIFYGYWSDETDEITGPHAVIINAITGEEL